MKKIFLLMFALLWIATAAKAQQLQTQTAPLFAANAKYVNGTSAGYAPTAGSGLTLNISAGRVNCSSTMTNYTGGTLTMTASATNYVYLNTASSCAPASNTTGYSSTTIPIATVVTGGSTITSITDDRTLGFATALGSSGGVTSWSGDGSMSCNSGSTGAVAMSLCQPTAGDIWGRPPGSGGGTNASAYLVQHTSSFNFSSSDSLAFVSSVTAGHAILIFGWVNVGTASSATVTDSSGGTPTLATSTGPAGIWYECSAHGGSTTIGISGGGGNWYALHIVEIQGNLASSCLDASGTASAGSSSSVSISTSGSLSTNDFVFWAAGLTGGGETFTPGASQTLIENVVGSFGLTSNSYYLNTIQNSGVQTGTATLSTTAPGWDGAIVAVKVNITSTVPEYAPPSTFGIVNADVHTIKAAHCINGTASGDWDYPTSTFTAACRAGTNNLGGALQATPSTGANAQFAIELPGDWVTSEQPYINIYFGSGSNTSGTVIWTVSSACVDVSTPGGASDDPSFQAESAFSTQTMAAASKLWYIGGEFTKITSANGCKPYSRVIIKVALSGTASSAINAYMAVVTIPRVPAIQAN